MALLAAVGGVGCVFVGGAELVNAARGARVSPAWLGLAGGGFLAAVGITQGWW